MLGSAEDSTATLRNGADYIDLYVSTKLNEATEKLFPAELAA